jgi:hypothetical protein
VELYVGTTTSGSLVPGAFYLVTAFSWLDANAADNGVYTIVLKDGETLNSTDLTSLNGADNVTITITTVDTTERIITLGTNGALFTVGGASGAKRVKLIMDGHLTLQGRSNNNVSLVRVNSTGALEMKGNSKITGNTVYFESSDSYGGGVYVDSGSFTMSGYATVSGNTTYSSGGGVYVENGSFDMSGYATVSGNTAYSFTTTTFDSRFSYGGGVYVFDGTFTMSGNTAVSGNTASASFARSDSLGSFGGGVSISVSSGNGSTFTKTGGVIYGNDEADTTLQNIVKVADTEQTNSGTAIVVRTISSITQCRETTVTVGQNLTVSHPSYTGQWTD